MDKTNVMRLLDQKKIEYTPYFYETKNNYTGEQMASILKNDPNQVFKTLVTVSSSKIYYVFVIPVNNELDLKLAAKAVNEKKIEMIKQKELLPLTGYIHGGCSPIGMKKQFITTIDLKANNFNEILISAGKLGYQIKINLTDLLNIIPYQLKGITKST